MTMMEFARYRLFTRRGQPNNIHQGKRLFQQYVVDQFSKIESQRLKFQRFNQNCLRAEALDELMAVPDNVASEDVGQRIILAPSHTGSPRFYQENYLNSMAVVRELGGIDLFLTFTCNPKWSEITEELLPGQSAEDRPDLCARVFNLKKNALFQSLFKDGLLRKAIAHMFSIEFQKRGLPHLHLLIILDHDSKPKTVHDYDR